MLSLINNLASLTCLVKLPIPYGIVLCNSDLAARFRIRSTEILLLY